MARGKCFGCFRSQQVVLVAVKKCEFLYVLVWACTVGADSRNDRATDDAINASRVAVSQQRFSQTMI